MTAETVQSEGLVERLNSVVGEMRLASLRDFAVSGYDDGTTEDLKQPLQQWASEVDQAVTLLARAAGPTDAFHLSCPSCGQAIDLIPADSVRNPTPSDHPDLAELVRRFLTPIPTKDGCALISIPALQFRFEEVIAPLLHRVETAEREREAIAALHNDLATDFNAQSVRVLGLQAQLAEARGALGPFARMGDVTQRYQDFAGRPIETNWASAFKRASEVFTSLSEKGE